MRTFRNHEQWRELILAQKDSGLNIADYCRHHQLPTSSFYSYRRRLGIAESAFVCAKISQQVEVFEQPSNIKVEFADAQVSLPSSTPPAFIAQLLRELAL